jgi:hypothetical protein
VIGLPRNAASSASVRREIQPKNQELDDRTEENSTENGEGSEPGKWDNVENAVYPWCGKSQYTHHDRHHRNRNHDRPDSETNWRHQLASQNCSTAKRKWTSIRAIKQN